MDGWWDRKGFQLIIFSQISPLIQWSNLSHEETEIKTARTSWVKLSFYMVRLQSLWSSIQIEIIIWTNHTLKNNRKKGNRPKWGPKGKSTIKLDPIIVKFLLNFIWTSFLQAFIQTSKQRDRGGQRICEGPFQSKVLTYEKDPHIIFYRVWACVWASDRIVFHSMPLPIL